VRIDCVFEHAGVPLRDAVLSAVLLTALASRFSSRGLDHFTNQALSAMHKRFGGHVEKPAE
jgi:6-phosphogluconate dehydrogenase